MHSFGRCKHNPASANVHRWGVIAGGGRQGSVLPCPTAHLNHQPRGGSEGQPRIYEFQAEEILRMRELTSQIIRKTYRSSYDTVERDGRAATK